MVPVKEMPQMIQTPAALFFKVEGRGIGQGKEAALRVGNGPGKVSAGGRDRDHVYKIIFTITGAGDRFGAATHQGDGGGSDFTRGLGAVVAGEAVDDDGVAKGEAAVEVVGGIADGEARQPGRRRPGTRCCRCRCRRRSGRMDRYRRGCSISHRRYW